MTVFLSHHTIRTANCNHGHEFICLSAYPLLPEFQMEHIMYQSGLTFFLQECFFAGETLDRCVHRVQYKQLLYNMFLCLFFFAVVVKISEVSSL